MSSFEETVLEWVRANDRTGRAPVQSIISVEGSGSDWAGDTEGGFYDVFSVDIRVTREDGRTDWIDAKGDQMESLWKHVVGAWPA